MQNFGPICIIIPKMNQIGDKVRKQDLSPDRIAHLIMHILFLEYSKSVTLILT